MGSTKHVIPQNPGSPGLSLFSSTAVSSTNTYTSATFNANLLDNIGIQVSFSGTMHGTLTINGSIDNVNFIPITFSPALTQPVGSAISYLVSLNQVPWPYINVAYTNASGSGTMTVYLSAKSV